MHIKGREGVTSPVRKRSSSPPFVVPPRREPAGTGSDAGSVDRVADGWRDGGKMNEEKKSERGCRVAKNPAAEHALIHRWRRRKRGKVLCARARV